MEKSNEITINKPLLSLVVPTKDRYYYLKHLIILIDSFKFENFELVIQDNTCDNGDILDYLKCNYFDFVKYYHTKKQISVSENSDLAILHSNGEYVCFIGDDDGISRYAIDVVKYMSDNKIESLSCLNVKYVWPNVHGVVWNFSATLLIDSFSGRFEEVDCQKERKKIFRRACWPYVGSKMPRVYQGIVKRTILDEVYKVTGSFFPGPSPDIANSIAISFYITKHVYSDLPLIISGSSNNSAAGKGAKHAHIGELKDQKFLGKDVESKWDKRIPKYWTGSSIYAESIIKTLECIDKREEIKYYNFNYLYALMYIYHPTIRSLIREKMSAKAWLFFPLGCMDVIIIRFFHLVKNMFIRMFGRNLYMNIDNIERCEDVLSKEVSMKINVEKSILSKDDRS